MKKTLIAFILILWSLLAGCASSQTYEELEAEYSITGDRSKLERRERQLELAEAFEQNKVLCLAHDDYIWACMNVHMGGRIKRRTSSMDIDATIREWKLQRSNGCGCIERSMLRHLF